MSCFADDYENLINKIPIHRTCPFDSGIIIAREKQHYTPSTIKSKSILQKSTKKTYYEYMSFYDKELFNLYDYTLNIYHKTNHSHKKFKNLHEVLGKYGRLVFDFDFKKDSLFYKTFIDHYNNKDMTNPITIKKLIADLSKLFHNSLDILGISKDIINEFINTNIPWYNIHTLDPESGQSIITDYIKGPHLLWTSQCRSDKISFHLYTPLWSSDRPNDTEKIIKVMTYLAYKEYNLLDNINYNIEYISDMNMTKETQNLRLPYMEYIDKEGYHKPLLKDPNNIHPSCFFSKIHKEFAYHKWTDLKLTYPPDLLSFIQTFEVNDKFIPLSNTVNYDPVNCSIYWELYKQRINPAFIDDFSGFILTERSNKSYYQLQINDDDKEWTCPICSHNDPKKIETHKSKWHIPFLYFLQDGTIGITCNRRGEYNASSIVLKTSSITYEKVKPMLQKLYSPMYGVPTHRIKSYIEYGGPDESTGASYCKPFPVYNDFRTLLCASAMGSGKTTCGKQLFDSLPDDFYVVVLIFRTSLFVQHNKDYQLIDKGFQHYIHHKDTWRNAKRIIVTIESLHQWKHIESLTNYKSVIGDNILNDINYNYDDPTISPNILNEYKKLKPRCLIFIDELEGLLAQFTSSTIKHLRRSLDKFEQLVRNSSHLVGLCADLNFNTSGNILVGYGRKLEDMVCIYNKTPIMYFDYIREKSLNPNVPSDYKKLVHLYDNQNTILKMCSHELRNNTLDVRTSVCTKNIANKIIQLRNNPSDRLQIIDGNSSIKNDSVDDTYKNFDVLVVNSTHQAGVSYMGTEYQTLICFVNPYGASVLSMLQMGSRIRYHSDENIFVSISNKSIEPHLYSIKKYIKYMDDICNNTNDGDLDDYFCNWKKCYSSANKFHMATQFVKDALSRRYGSFVYQLYTELHGYDIIIHNEMEPINKNKYDLYISINKIKDEIALNKEIDDNASSIDEEAIRSRVNELQLQLKQLQKDLRTTIYNLTIEHNLQKPTTKPLSIKWKHVFLQLYLDCKINDKNFNLSNQSHKDLYLNLLYDYIHSSTNIPNNLNKNIHQINVTYLYDIGKKFVDFGSYINVEWFYAKHIFKNYWCKNKSDHIKSLLAMRNIHSNISLYKYKPDNKFEHDAYLKYNLLLKLESFGYQRHIDGFDQLIFRANIRDDNEFIKLMNILQHTFNIKFISSQTKKCSRDLWNLIEMLLRDHYGFMDLIMYSNITMKLSELILSNEHSKDSYHKIRLFKYTKFNNILYLSH